MMKRRGLPRRLLKAANQWRAIRWKKALPTKHPRRRRSMMISSGGLTNRVDRLAKANLVERRRSTEDRRGVIVELTPAGFDMIEEMLTVHVDRQTNMLTGLSKTEVEQLDQLLSRLVDSINREHEK